MKGFLLGLVVAALAFGGYLVWKQRSAPPPVRAIPDAAPPAPAKEKKKRRRGAARVARAPVDAESAAGARPAGSARPAPPTEEAEPEPVRLSAADLRSTAQGDDLSRPDVVRLDMSDPGSSRELGQDEIDAVFRAREGAILDCISRARPDPETYVPGRITVKFRIQRQGTVRGVRVEAPAILQKGGVYGCIKGVLSGMHFPSAGSSQIVTYPFTLS